MQALLFLNYEQICIEKVYSKYIFDRNLCKNAYIKKKKNTIIYQSKTLLWKLDQLFCQSLINKVNSL